MNKPYSLFASAALVLLSLGASAQGPKPGLEHVRNADPQRGGGPPANDECTGAVPITVGTPCTPTDGSSVGATQSMDPASDCGPYVSPDAFDVWFSFQATSAYTKLDVTGTGDYDVAFQVFSGTCDALEPMGCADLNYPDPGNGILDVTETLTVPTTSGDTYYVRVYYYSSPIPEDMTFSICAQDGTPPPANDDCTGAVAQDLSVGSTIMLTGDNSGATQDMEVGATLVWNAFTTTECADVTLYYCVEGSEFTNFEPIVVTDCSDLENTAVLGGVDGCSVHFIQLQPGTYMVPIYGSAPEAPVGAYSVQVTAAACDPYCAAGSDACDEFTSLVSFGTISNSSDCGATYQNFTDQTTSVTPGQSLPINVTNNPDSYYAEDQCTAWFDWNQDYSFDGANEMFTLASDDEGATYSGTVLVPADALPGATRMRVRMQYDDDVVACGNTSYGDVEDYTVVVEQGEGVAELHAGNWAIFPNPSNGDISIAGLQLDGQALIEVRDMTGRLVYTTNRTFKTGEVSTLHLAGQLATGTYHLVLTTPSGRTVRPVMVR